MILDFNVNNQYLVTVLIEKDMLRITERSTVKLIQRTLDQEGIQMVGISARINYKTSFSGLRHQYASAFLKEGISEHTVFIVQV